MSPAELAALTEALRTQTWESFGSADTVVRLDRAFAPTAAVWCVAFDEHGPTARWRGAAALDMHRVPASPT